VGAIELPQGRHVHHAPVGAKEAIDRRCVGHDGQAGDVVFLAPLRGPGVADIHIARMAQPQGMADLVHQRRVAFAARGEQRHRLHVHPDVAWRSRRHRWRVGHTLGRNLLADAKIRPAGAGIEAEGKNTGCPANEEEVNYFIDVLKKTTPLKNDELGIIRKRFRKNEAK